MKEVVQKLETVAKEAVTPAILFITLFLQAKRSLEFRDMLERYKGKALFFCT